LLLFAFASFPAHGADDSNSGQLTQVPTVSAAQLNSALSTLAQGTNNTQLQQLLQQFQSEMSGGNYTEADSTLIKLQNLANSDPQGVPFSLNALLQSLSVGSQGPSVDSSTLASLLNSNPDYASGSNQTPQELSIDMQSLASLMQYANSTLASQLLQDSNQLSKSAFGGGASGSVPVSLPGMSGFSGLSIGPVGTPGISVGAPSGGLPSVPIADFLIPILIAGVVAALYLSRGRLGRVVGGQVLPGIGAIRRAKLEAAAEEVPSDPRKMIEFYWRRAVGLMTRRGVPKDKSETHREFAAKCETTPERPLVGAISSLYEKAVFSGQEVGAEDARLAASSFQAMESQGR